MSSLFIQYYNVFAEENSKYHLSIEELYLYGLLSMLKNKEQLTITNVDILQQYSPINFFSRKTESKQRIKNNLLSLKQKDVITFPVDDVKNNSLLIISYMDNLIDESIGKGVHGFEKVEYDKFNSFPSMIDNYIYFTVKRFNKLDGFKCDYERWSYILDVTDKTARVKIDEAVKSKIIYKNIGDYKDELIGSRKQKKQEVNTYKTIPFANEEKSIQTKKEDVKEQQKELIENEVNNPAHDETETREHNWNVNKSELTANDFFIFLTTQDEELKKKAEMRIAGMRKYPKSEYVCNTLMDEAKQMIKDVEKKKEKELLKSATNAIRLNDGTIVVVDKDNIDNYKYDDIKTIFYRGSSGYYDGQTVFEQNLNREFDIRHFQPIKDFKDNNFNYQHKPDMIQNGLDKFKKIMKDELSLDMDTIEKIKDEVFDESGVLEENNPFKPKTKTVTLKSSNSKKDVDKKRNNIEPIDISSIGVSDLDIDLMNEIMERDNVKKKDERDISFLLDEEEQPKKSTSNAIEWIDKMYKEKRNPFENKDKKFPKQQDDDWSFLDDVKKEEEFDKRVKNSLQEQADLDDEITELLK